MTDPPTCPRSRDLPHQSVCFCALTTRTLLHSFRSLSSLMTRSVSAPLLLQTHRARSTARASRTSIQIKWSVVGATILRVGQLPISYYVLLFCEVKSLPQWISFYASTAVGRLRDAAKAVQRQSRRGVYRAPRRASLSRRRHPQQRRGLASWPLVILPC